MNANLQNDYVGSGIDLINSHALSQFNESSNLNEMNWDVLNVYVSDVHCYINSHTLYEANNHNSIDYTRKRDENSPNRSEMENSVLQDGIDIGVMLPESALQQYSNLEDNNEYHYLSMNGKM